MERQWLQSHNNRWIDVVSGNAIEYSGDGFKIIFTNSRSEIIDMKYTNNIIRFLRVNVFGQCDLPEEIK